MALCWGYIASVALFFPFILLSVSAPPLLDFGRRLCRCSSALKIDRQLDSTVSQSSLAVSFLSFVLCFLFCFFLLFFTVLLPANFSCKLKPTLPPSSGLSRPGRPGIA